MLELRNVIKIFFTPFWGALLCSFSSRDNQDPLWFPLTCLVSNSRGKHLWQQNKSRLQAAFPLVGSHVNELPTAWLAAQNGKKGGKKKHSSKVRVKLAYLGDFYGHELSMLPGTWHKHRHLEENSGRKRTVVHFSSHKVPQISSPLVFIKVKWLLKCQSAGCRPEAVTHVSRLLSSGLDHPHSSHPKPMARVSGGRGLRGNLGFLPQLLAQEG